MLEALVREGAGMWTFTFYSEHAAGTMASIFDAIAEVHRRFPGATGMRVIGTRKAYRV